MGDAVQYAANLKRVADSLANAGLPAKAVRAAVQAILPGGHAFEEFVRNGSPRRQEGPWASRVSVWANSASGRSGVACDQSFISPDKTCRAGASVGVDEPPTQAQKEAGNYAKRKLSFQGLPISIENEKDSDRSGVGPDGKKWTVAMPAHYGYIRKTEGVDGDHVDVYVGPNEESDRVFVIEQVNAETKKFDEHKCMVGFNTEDEARSVYHRAFSDGKGPDRIGKLTPMTMAEFKEWLKDFKVSNRDIWKCAKCGGPVGNKMPDGTTVRGPAACLDCGHVFGEQIKNQANAPWIGVDLDGSLAVQDGDDFRPDVIGAVVEPMRELVLRLIGEGKTVKIFTARAANPENIPHVVRWLESVGLPPLEVTNVKDPGMIALYDDRAVAVERNTGRILGGDESLANMMAANLRWIEELHPRDATGKFAPKDAAEPPKAPEAKPPRRRVRRAVVADVEAIPLANPDAPAAPQPAEARAPEAKANQDEADTRAHKLATEISSGSDRTKSVIGGNHISAAYLVTYKTPDANGNPVENKVVFKPVEGERKGARRNIRDTEVPAASREMAAFDVATKLGIRIPDVASVELDGKPGTAMRFLKRDDKEHNDIINNVQKPDPSRLTELAVFDFVIGNTDRHAGNLIVTKGRDLNPIDHGLSFPEASVSNSHALGIGGNISVFASWASRQNSRGGHARLKQLSEQINTPEFHAYLRSTAVKRGLSPLSAELAIERSKYLHGLVFQESPKGDAELVERVFKSAKEKGWYV